MNPTGWSINEAQRTFTYLNLYGYLTDAVVVNRVFPDEVGGGYFGEWRERQRERLDGGRARASRRSRCCAPATSTRRWSGRRCSTASAPSCSPSATRRRCSTPSWPARSSSARTASRRCGSGCRSPSAPRSSLKKVGAELVVAVGPREADYHPPAALARRSPRAQARGRCARGDTDSRPSRASAAREPEPERPSSHGRAPALVELCPICRGADVLRATSPESFADQWQEVQREALLTMRAMIDLYLERLAEAEGGAERGPPDRLAPPVVEHPGSARPAHCGTENPQRARFCMSCGSALAAGCPSCGTENPAGARFCIECGATLAAGRAAGRRAGARSRRPRSAARRRCSSPTSPATRRSPSAWTPRP